MVVITNGVNGNYSPYVSLGIIDSEDATHVSEEVVLVNEDASHANKVGRRDNVVTPAPPCKLLGTVS